MKTMPDFRQLAARHEGGKCKRFNCYHISLFLNPASSYSHPKYGKGLAGGCSMLYSYLRRVLGHHLEAV